jgi:hypothetical protein
MDALQLARDGTAARIAATVAAHPLHVGIKGVAGMLSTHELLYRYLLLLMLWQRWRKEWRVWIWSAAVPVGGFE